MSDRRIATRVDARLPFFYRRLDERDFTRSDSVNISEKGLRVLLRRPQAIERVLQLKVLFPGAHEMANALGRVVWLKRGFLGAEAGIELMDVGADFSEKARSFIQ
jgi:hypothetical protein